MPLGDYLSSICYRTIIFCSTFKLFLQTAILLSLNIFIHKIPPEKHVVKLIVRKQKFCFNQITRIWTHAYTKSVQQRQKDGVWGTFVRGYYKKRGKEHFWILNWYIRAFLHFMKKKTEGCERGKTIMHES